MAVPKAKAKAKAKRKPVGRPPKKRPTGRPPKKITAALLKRAREMAQKGATLGQIASGLGVSYPTFIAMRDDSPELCAAIQEGEELADGAVQSALLENALAGNVIAQKHWLNNRKPDKWGDSNKVEHSGKVSLADMTHEDRLKHLR